MVSVDHKNVLLKLNPLLLDHSDNKALIKRP